MKKMWVAALALLLLAGCKQKNDAYKTMLANPNLFAKTVHELNSVVMGNNFSPIVASRNYAYASLAAYEAMAAGHADQYQSLSGQIKHMPPMPKTASTQVNYDLAALLAFIKVGEAVTFPEGSMSEYRDSIVQLAQQNGLPDDVLEATQQFVDTLTSSFIAWTKKDNYAATRGSVKYTVIDTPGRWVPTPPMYADAIEPNWTKIRPLVMDSSNMFVPPPPIPFNVTDKNSAYYKQVMQVKEARENLTKEQEHIAWFWDDNPMKLNVSGHVMFSTKKFSPPGHWMSIVGIAAQKANMKLPETISAYALTSIALFDGFIQCWDEKFRSNAVRPETVINKYFDADWMPLLQTPPFPEYTCGHSTVSASAAEALTSLFGDNFAFTDSTELEFGIANRSFTSFRHAAEENNLARFYGGIHFHPSCLVSTDYGKKVGTLVVNRIKMKK